MTLQSLQIIQSTSPTLSSLAFFYLIYRYSLFIDLPNLMAILFQVIQYFNFFIFHSLFFAYMCMCICSRMCRCMHMQRLKMNTGCLYQSFLRQKFSLNIRRSDSARVAGHWLQGSLNLCLHPGSGMADVYWEHVFLHVCWAFELRFSCFHSKPFTN